MKLLYDYLPIALFFITYKMAGIYTATMVAIAAAILQVGFFWLKHKRFETMHVVTLVLITTLGGLTLILRDKSFIMYKPSIVNGLFALAFIISAFIGKKPLIRRLLDSQIQLPDPVWHRLNLLWVIFFLFSAAVNIYFVKDYQTAELELRQLEPTIEATTFSELNCERDFTENNLELCLKTKDKEETWVNFKLFGMLGMTFIFIILQGVYLHRHMTIKEEAD